MNLPRGVRVEPTGGRLYASGNQFAFHLRGMRFAIQHPEQPDKMILFGPEDVAVVFHPEFGPEPAGDGTHSAAPLGP